MFHNIFQNYNKVSKSSKQSNLYGCTNEIVNHIRYTIKSQKNLKIKIKISGTISWCVYISTIDPDSSPDIYHNVIQN